MRRLILIIAAVLMLVMLTAVMTGCGGDGDAGKGTDTGKDTATQPPVVPTPEDAAEETPDIALPDESPDAALPDESLDIALPDESPVAGFSFVNSIVDEGFTESQYVGSGTATEALELFHGWAEEEGWSLLQEDFSDIPDDTGTDMQDGLSEGRLYEKDSETMSITAMEVEGQIYVTITVSVGSG